MSNRVPSFLLLVPGVWSSIEQVITPLRAAGLAATTPSNDPFAPGAIEVSLVRDPELGRSVSAAGDESLPARQLAGVDQAALVEIGRRLDDEPHELARLGAALRAAGGLAVRMERLGRAFAWDAWLARVERGTPIDLYEVGVTLARDADGSVFSVGMHHFDLPDAEMPVGADLDAAARWLHAFHLFQLVESPTLASGHTFQPDVDAKRRVFERWPDGRHHPDDGRANPFGLWRFLAEGEVGVTPRDRAPTFIPPLAALLAARESEQGRALTRDEVEAVRDGAVVMTLELADARAMERARGYADLEPERAWEQWQIVRRR